MQTLYTYLSGSFASLIMILALAICSGCSRGYGCYYSDAGQIETAKVAYSDDTFVGDQDPIADIDHCSD